MPRVAIVSAAAAPGLHRHASGFRNAIQRSTRWQLGGVPCEAVVTLGISPQAAGEQLNAGRHVLLVDPAYSASQLDELARLARARHVRLAVGRTLRSMGYQAAVRDSLDRELLGKPGLLRIHHWRPSSGAPADWTMLALNELDLACWLFESAPVLLYARSQAENMLQVHLGFTDGGMALVDGHGALPATAEPYYALTLIGSRGAAYADDHRNTHLLLGNDLKGLRSDQGDECCDIILDVFAKQLANETDADSSVLEAIRAARVMQAAIDSVHADRPFKLVGDDYEPE